MNRLYRCAEYLRRSDLAGGAHKTQTQPNFGCASQTLGLGRPHLMASCYWAQPGQLHPWYRLDTLKRKLPAMFPRSESPSPMDEYDDDTDPARAKRQRRLTLDQTRPTKRKLSSPPESPTTTTTEEPGQSERGGDTHLVKRQRCTTLERGLESLSLAALPSPPPARAQAQAQAQAAPDFSTRLSLPPLAAPPSDSALPLRHHHDAPPPDFASLRWPETSASPTTTTVPSSFSISSLRPPPPPFPISTPITPASFAHALTVNTDAITDVKMRSSSWYEPQKDRTCPLALFVLSLARARLFAD